MSNLKERIQKLKEQDHLKDLKKAEEKVVVEVSLKSFQELTKKLAKIELGAEKNLSKKELLNLLFAKGITADTLQGLTPSDFSLKSHEHKEIESLVTRETFLEWKNDIQIDADKISKGLIDIFYDIEKLKNNDETLKINKEIAKIQEKAANFNNKIDKLEQKGFVVNEHLDLKGFRITNLANPKSSSDAVNKKYVDGIAATISASIPNILGGSPQTETLSSGTSLPDQAGNNGKFLATDGATPYWAALLGGGDMLSSTYDPQNISGDAFSMQNMVEGASAKILTVTERSKLAGIQDGAEVNVQADWNAETGDAKILNKPTVLDAQALASSDTPTFADITITGLGGNIITSESVETGMEALDDAVTAMNDSGFGAWTSGTDANTYTLSGGTFTLDRSGYGYVNGKKISWAASQSIGSFAANTFYWIYIDSSGNIQKTSTFIPNVIRLFEILYDGTIYMVSKENHPIGFDQGASGYLHNNAGTTIRSTGAIITRVATGTGASADDRRIKIVGADVLDDHGLSTTIAEQNPVTWNVFYRNASGKWIRYSQVTELPNYYNNAGTPTSIDIVNHHCVYTLYVAKDDIENSAPQYIAVMDEAVYTTSNQAEAAVAAGNVVFATNELKSVEAAQLGYAFIHQGASGYYIHDVSVAKSSFNQVLVGGSAGSDHGLLSGLADDDHTQYALANGSRGSFAAPLGTDDNYVTDTEKANLHAPTSDNQDLSGLLPKSGGTMTGALIADENTDYTTPQMRNVILSTGDPSGGQNGDVWIKYVA